MNRNFEILPSEVHEFIDGELDRERTLEIADHLKWDGALARKISVFRSDKELVRSHLNYVSEQALPESWIAQIEAHPEKKPGWTFVPQISREYLMALAASVIVILGAWLSYANYAAPQEDAILAEALAARQNRLQVEQVYPADSLAAAEDRDQVLQAALALNVKAPDLGKFGYRLTDIRVYPESSNGKAVELEYRDTQTRLFSLYLRKPSGPPKVDMLERDGKWTCIWQDEVLGAVMQGEMSAGEMARIVSVAYFELNL